MFGKILVALDGSQLAECALAPALVLAAKFGSHVILLQVVVAAAHAALAADTESPYPNDNGSATQFHCEEAEDYLRGIQASYRGSGLNLQVEVAAGEPAMAITALAAAQNVDLIVMSTHGRSGIMRLLYGSVAEAVLRGAHTPLLLVPITGRPAIEGWKQLFVTPIR
jgi:nucleotide-binding universal stress UspA family protein